MEVRTCLFQVDLAKRVGVGEMTIVYWEKARAKPIKQYLEVRENFGWFAILLV